MYDQFIFPFSRVMLFRMVRVILAASAHGPRLDVGDWRFTFGNMSKIFGTWRTGRRICSIT